MPTPKKPRIPKATAAAPLVGPDDAPLPPVPPPASAAPGPIRAPSPPGSQRGVQTIGRPTPVPPHMGTMLGGVVLDPATGRPAGLTLPEAAQWDAAQLVDHTRALLASAAALQDKAGAFLEAIAGENARLYQAAALLAVIDLDQLAALHLDLEALLLKHPAHA